jgi:hemerythrin-like metal-binding protein
MKEGDSLTKEGPMAHIQWKDQYSIGYKDIDAQHRVLLALLNELIDLIDRGGAPEQVSSIFHRLCSYALVHFSNEERYLKAAGYPDLGPQQSNHAIFVHQLLAFNEAYDASDPRLLAETQSFLRHWFLDHILNSDMAYVPHMTRYRRNATLGAVLFDFGNVLCRFDNARFLEGLSTLCGRPAQVLGKALYEDSTLTQDHEAGRIGSVEFLRGVSALCGTELPEADFIRIYTDIFTPIQALST